MRVRDALEAVRARMRAAYDEVYAKHRGEEPYVPPQQRPAYLDALPPLAELRAIRDGASDDEWADAVALGAGPQRTLLRVDLPDLPSLSAPSHATSVSAELLLAGDGDEPIAWWLHTGWRAGGNFVAEGPFEDVRATIARAEERREAEHARLEAKVPDAAALAESDFWDEGVDVARVATLLEELCAKGRPGRRCVVAPDATLRVFRVGEYGEDESGCLTLPHIHLTRFGAREHLGRALRSRDA